MEENIPWKSVFIGAIFSLIVLAFAYYLISQRETPYLPPDSLNKVAEFKSTKIEGRKEGKVIWEFFAQEGFTIKDQGTTSLLNVKKGKIYKADQLSMTIQFIPLLKINRAADVIEAYGSTESRHQLPQLTAYFDLGKFTPGQGKQQWTKFKADFIRYLPNEKRSEVNGRIHLNKAQLAITADNMTIDHNLKLATLTNRVVVSRKNGTITTDGLEYTGETELSQARGNVTLNLRDKKIVSRIHCQAASFFNDGDKDINLSGSVEVVQGKKQAVADSGLYSKQQGGLRLTGNVKAVFEKARNILENTDLTNLDNQETKTILRNKTLLFADELFLSTKSGDAQASGQVLVTQKGREAKSAQAVYEDKKELLIMTGNVSLKKGNNWIKCKKVVVSINKETFEAVGSVEAALEL